MRQRLPRRPGLIASASLALLLLGASGGTTAAAAPPDVGAVAFQKTVTKAQSPQLTDFRLARRSGAEHTRVNISWRAVDNTVTRGLPNLHARTDGRRCTNPLYDWCALDRLLRRYESIGLPVKPVLLGTPPWASARGCRVRRGARACHPAPVAMDEWRRFVSSAVRRYGPNGTFWNALRADDRFDMDVWEVWNEPDLHFFWDGRRGDPPARDAREYANLVKVTEHAVDSGAFARGRTARIAGPSVSRFAPDRPGAWLGAFASHDARHLLDVVSGHLYGGGARRVIAQVDAYRRLLPNRPMWITENGFGTGSRCPSCVGNERTQRSQFRQLMTLLGRRGYVEAFTWFMGARHPAFQGTHGLYRNNGSPRPIVGAFKRAAAD